MTASKPSVFLMKVSGQVETGEFIDSDSIYFTYFYYYGQDWEILKGLEEGSSQMTKRSADERNIFVWNFPIDVTFKSSNPFGWPQLILSIYGCDFFGKEIVMGYAPCRLPISPGRCTKRIPTFVPDSASTMQKIVSWFTGRRPELVDPKTVAKGRGREVIRVRSEGFVTVTLDVIFKDLGKLGYRSGGQETTTVHSKADGILSKLLRESEPLDDLAREPEEKEKEKKKEKKKKENDQQKPSTSGSGR